METRPLLSIAIELDPAEMLGTFPVGERRLVTFRSGTFDGVDGLRGTVAPGGVDWQLVRPDGAMEIRAHYLLRTHQGEPIEVESTGLRVAAPDVAARLAAGAPVDPAEYYFRTHIRLHTSSSRWQRLNSIIAVSTGERRAADVAIHVHEVC
jgi:Protein of unknown function (DUF3237)